MSANPTVYAFADPTITIDAGQGISVATRCDADELYIPKSRIISVRKQEREILLTLSEGQIIQLYDLPNSRSLYAEILALMKS
jgi:hypothetical protein